MKRILLLLITVCLTHLLLMANPVDVSTAHKVASNFLKNVGGETSSLTLVYSRGDEYYVFGTPQSFVIVAGDTRVNPILGYSKEGPWVDPGSQSDPGFASNFWGMMDNFEKQIKSSKQQNLVPNSDVKRNWQSLESGQMLKSAITPVKPLLTTKWNQVEPYNALFPKHSSNYQAVVGCVGVAMAQIMKYHNYPERGAGKNGYQFGDWPYVEADFAATTYKWSDMPDSITEINNSIATLMYHCAVSVYSMWRIGETAVISTIGEDDIVALSFIKNFKYAYSSIRSIGSWEYTPTQWDSILYTELINKRPIYYAGSGSGEHAFVCDGVDQNNFYHFNFGWGGRYNGYYALNTINPIGRDYSQSQYAIIGIKPNDGSTIAQDTTWKGNMTISSDVVVVEGVTLTIQAGSEIKFAKDTKLLLWGSLSSIGSKEYPIKFTALDTMDRWNGIKFYFYGDKKNTSQMTYTQVEYSKNHGLFANGRATGYGTQGKIEIDHCKFNNNYGGPPEYEGTRYMRSGGAICAVYVPSISITNSEIFNNKSDESGGGMLFESCNDVKIVGNKIHRNVAGEGGGIQANSVNLLLENNLISHNKTKNTAGGLNLLASKAIVQHNKICNNSVDIWGGAGIKIYQSNSLLINNLIASNTSNVNFLQIEGSDSIHIINNTIVNNKGSIAIYGDSPLFKNNIIYGNGDEDNSSPDPLFVRPFGAGLKHCRLPV